ncbi:hypothetical protein [Rugamonas sp.]|uniref:hypothetical protein n=1 Tax=Rugamonas sp. TaxID=1926287 RepID=UPI0025D7951B|nr:hypothetical protein [Rugamonas sp.]
MFDVVRHDGTVNMNLQFDIARRFEEDLERLSPRDRERVATSIDRHAAVFDAGSLGAMRRIYQPQKILLPEGLQSSLFVLRVSEEVRVILTIEEDPLFDRKVITLLRVVRRDQVDRSYLAVSESWRRRLAFERLDSRRAARPRFRCH